MESTIKLFRRHASTCTAGHPKECRVYEYDSAKQTHKAQCSCTICAEGSLLKHDGSKLYIKAKSTGESTWDKARSVVERWKAEQSTEYRILPPVPQPPQEEYKLVTVADAVRMFTETMKDNLGDSTRLKQYDHLLSLRLIPFAKAHNIDYIQQMDSADAWAKFRTSWRNLNPNHNRKGPKGDQKVGKRTEKRLIEDLRAFLGFCESREWQSDNWATKKKHRMFVSLETEQKEPFSEEELQYIWQAADCVTDGRGGTTLQRRTGTQNGREALVFAWVLRYTGLRISDVTALNIDQIVPCDAGRYTHAIYCNPEKTKNKEKGNFVFLPIPNSRFPGDPDLVTALQSLPLKHGRFFFLGGGELPTTKEGWKTRLKQATNGWRERINRLFTIAEGLMEKEGKAFTFHPHPHRFRHTFASTLLKAGVSLRVVAQYLGDIESTVRKHYSKFCTEEQMDAAKALDEAMRRRSEQQKDKQRLRIASASQQPRR